METEKEIDLLMNRMNAQLEIKENGAADTQDIEPNFENEEKNSSVVTKELLNSKSNNHLQWLTGKSQTISGIEEEKKYTMNEQKKKRDVIGNALRMGAAKKYADKNRRMSMNNDTEKILDYGFEPKMTQSSTSTGWYLPNNADMLTPQGKMLLNLSEKLRTKTGQNQHQHKEELTIGQIRNCRSFTNVNDENESEKATENDMLVNNASSVGRLEQMGTSFSAETQDNNFNRPSTSKNDNLPTFNDISEKKTPTAKHSGFYFGLSSKFFRSRAKSEANKRENVYTKNDDK